MQSAELGRKTRSNSLRLILLGSTVVSLLAALHYLAPARSDLWWQVFFQTSHAPIFGIIAVCLLAMTPSGWRSRARLIIALSATLLLALLSEAIQIPVANRSASLGDVINDIISSSFGFWVVDRTFLVVSS